MPTGEFIPGMFEDYDLDAPTKAEKLCPACRRVLFRTDFDTNQFAPDGYYSYCKTCRAEKLKEVKDPLPPIEAVEAPPPDSTIARTVIPAGILNGIQVPETVEAPMPGVWAWTNVKGWRVVAIHHSADPSKSPDTEEGRAWIDKKKADMSERDWKREMDMDHTIAEGDPFYATFNRSLHVGRCVYNPDKPLLRGWDFGRSHPSIVMAQLDDKAKIRIVWSQIYTNVNLYQLVPMILAETNARFPNATVRDYGDPAGSQETDKGATTAILLDSFKIKLQYRFSWIEEGAKMIEQKLLMQSDGTPGLLIDPCNKDLIAGFESGYVLDTGTSGKDGEGRLKNLPKKDGWYEHVMDALRYLVVNLFTMMPDSKTDADEAWKKIGLWRTNAEHAKHTEESDDAEFLL